MSPRFDEHPAIQESLIRAKNEEMSHREALGRFDPSVLREAARLGTPGTDAGSW